MATRNYISLERLDEYSDALAARLKAGLAGKQDAGDYALTSDVPTELVNALKTKLDGIESGAQANVQADWSVTDTESDAYIRNKPSSLPASDVYDWAKASEKPSYTAAEVGLGNVENYKQVRATEKGAANGVATLDENGFVPSSQLPSYVDDVEEYASYDSFPTEGESGKIYVALDTNMTYRWGGTTYVAIASSLALGETASTAYAGSKGKQNATDIASLKTSKQDKLTAGDNITIEGTVISATVPTDYVTASSLETALAAKQDVLTSDDATFSSAGVMTINEATTAEVEAIVAAMDF